MRLWATAAGGSQAWPQLDRSHRVKILHVGIVPAPERFVCAWETFAVVPVPPLTSLEPFDSGAAIADEVARRLIDHVPTGVRQQPRQKEV